MVILMVLRFDGDDMRFLTILMLAGLPCAALAQTAVTEVQKTPQSLLAGEPPTAALGLPADPDAPKSALLASSKATDALTFTFDSDKIAGNAPVAPPMGQQNKAPGVLPDPAPGAADLGTGPEGEKVAVLAVTKAGDGRTTTYDTDKIDGNPETFPPLAERQKAPGGVPEGVAEADFGLPANVDFVKANDLAANHATGRPTIYDEDKIDGNEPPPAPLGERQKAPGLMTASLQDADLGIFDTLPAIKSADLPVSAAIRVTSIYDEDKIDGNEPATEQFDDSYFSGPLAERQKYPAELTEGADPLTFGQPNSDAPKQADLGISKAEIAVPNIEDNDKIAGNPYVTPPLLPRQKAPGLLPDPVVDADMGQPAVGVLKVDLPVSKSADGQPSVEDYDKIVGNAFVAPPMSERAKGPTYEGAIAGLSDEDLGVPAAPDAAKVADMAVAKGLESVTTEYDDDKIAGNSYVEPAFTDEYTDGYDSAPPPELVAQVRTLLDDPATREGMISGIQMRAQAPAPISLSYQSFIGALFDVPQVRDLLASEIASVFVDVGLTPESPAPVGRMAAEYLATFGEAEAARGMARRSGAEQRAYLADTLRIAKALTPEQCGPFLGGTMDASQQRGLILAAIAAWPEADRNAILIHRAAAIIADVTDNPALDPMPDDTAGIARAQVGEAALAAIDAAENGPALLAAFGDPYGASPADQCAVHKLILEAALVNTTPDADLGVRYLVEFGWQN